MPIASPPSLLCALLLAALPAQRQFATLRPAGLPATVAAARSLAVGDVDGDGWPDLVIGQDGAGTLLLRGDPAGGFRDATAGQLPADSGNTRALVLTDVDGDGDLDLVLGNAPRSQASATNRLYRNDGAGRLTDASSGAFPGYQDPTLALAAGDVDGDGKADLVVANGDDANGAGWRNRLLLGDGRGRFAEAAASALPADVDPSRCAVLVDVDGDRDLDLLVGNGDFERDRGAADRLYLNDGSGTFRRAPGTALPNRSDVTGAIAVGDVDGDGDPDLVLACGGARRGAPNRLYRNDGHGAFREVGGALPATAARGTTAALADLDADGDLDLLLGNHREPDEVLYNDGTGAFRARVGTSLPDEQHRTRAVAAVDIDADSRPDAICLDAAGVRAYLADGLRWFDVRESFRLPLGPRDTRAALLLDADADGDLDLLLGGAEPDLVGSLELLANDGRGSFTRVTSMALPPGAPEVRAFATGDLDGDGDADVAIANIGPDWLLLGDGRGGFTRGSGLPARSSEATAIALGDLDGDRDLDVIVAEQVTALRSRLVVYRNDGDARFSAVELAARPSGPVQALAAADLDGDGDLDLALGEGVPGLGRANEVFAGDGRGGFTPVPGALPSHAEATGAVCAVDLDGDSDLDLLIASGKPGTARVYRNDGGGRFRDATSSLSPWPHAAASAAAGDLDGDGRVDLLLGRDGGAAPMYFRNTGGGSFLEVSASRLDGDLPPSPVLALGDVDGDDDLDLVLAGVAPQLLVNLHRQLHPPRVAQAGFAFALDVHSQPGYGGAGPHVVIPMLALRALRTPVAVGGFGNLALPLGEAVLLPQVTVPRSTGRRTLSFVLPSLLPPLAGHTIFAQAFTMPGPQTAGWRLGNATASFVLR